MLLLYRILPYVLPYYIFPSYIDNNINNIYFTLRKINSTDELDIYFNASRK